MKHSNRLYSQNEVGLYMRICIPRLGQTIVLTKSWKFKLKQEGRNESAISVLGGTSPTLPKGTSLKVDRIYIMAAGVRAFDYDSVTFKMIVDRKTVRFFVSLSDANNIDCKQPEPVIKEIHKVVFSKEIKLERGYWRLKSSYPSKSALIANIKGYAARIIFTQVRIDIPEHPDWHNFHIPGVSFMSRWNHALYEEECKKWRDMSAKAHSEMEESGRQFMKKNGITFSNMLDRLPEGVKYVVLRIQCDTDQEPVELSPENELDQQ